MLLFKITNQVLNIFSFNIRLNDIKIEYSNRNEGVHIE